MDLEKLVTFYHLHRMLSRRPLQKSSSNRQHSMMTTSKISLLVTLVLKKIHIWLHSIPFLSDIIILLLTDSKSSDQVNNISLAPVRSGSGLDLVSVRSRYDMGPVSIRSRSGLGPVSVRYGSGLDPVSIRSRSGLDPVSARSRSIPGPGPVRMS